MTIEIGDKFRVLQDNIWGSLNRGDEVGIRYLDADGDGWFTLPNGDRDHVSLHRINLGWVEKVEEEDVVNHPNHYTKFGAEVIEIAGYLNFPRGNAVKYIARAGSKDPDKELEDLRKAKWYLEWEINRLEAQNGDA